MTPERVSVKKATSPSSTLAFLVIMATVAGSSSKTIPVAVAVTPPTMPAGSSLSPAPFEAGSKSGRDMVT